MHPSADVVVEFLTIVTVSHVAVEQSGSLSDKGMLAARKFLASQLNEDHNREQ